MGLSLRRWLKSLLTPQPADPEGEADEGRNTDPQDPFAEPVRLEITDVLDLHAFHPRDVRAVVEEYLYQAHAAGFTQVRIIHGKGVGAQRERVRRILSRTSFVEDFTDAPASAGGWGATVARLKTQPPSELH